MPKEPVYLLEQVGRNYKATTISRVVGYRTRSGQDVVRFDRFWQPLHTAKALRKFIATKTKRKGSTFVFDGRPYPLGFVARPFVKDWEGAIGVYPTFGPGGV